ncbi:tetraspanin 14 L homeolog isoform X2 [Xenopus laevis]|uniref:Tetraspanin 14 L homeolog isoform X2 n=1 Tax=Xenopus laevis TaxID=8355 RepID=A0A8J1L4I0_XENLA|nr:tetraspanin 14 L homeolog isoform X2 [Xenopus laevis]
MHYYRYSTAEVSCCYKYLLFSYNIIFWLSGMVLLGVGLWAWSEKGILSDITKVTRLHGFDPVWLVLVVGVIMFTLGFAGCVGALRENICLLKFNQCCGAVSPDDWDLNEYFNCSIENPSRERCGVPFSCCVPDPAQTVVNTQCGYDARKKKPNERPNTTFSKGCISAMEAWLPRNIYIVAGVFLVISVLQIFGIYLARTLMSDIDAVKAGYRF